MEETSTGHNNRGALSKHAVLVAFEAPVELRHQLETAGAHVIVCPELKIEPPESHTALDEAIENLYGYDWLIFITSHSVKFFLKRFHVLGHEISHLDSLSVCALGESTVTALEESRVHIDVMLERHDPQNVLAALATYVGGASALRGLNFLLPQATIGRDYLKDDLDEAGARADVVPTYQTVAGDELILPRLRTLILSGGVDCVLFGNATEVRSLAVLLDVNDLSRLLRNIAVVCLDDSAGEAAARLGIREVIRPAGPGFPELIAAIASQLFR